MKHKSIDVLTELLSYGCQLIEWSLTFTDGTRGTSGTHHGNKVKIAERKMYRLNTSGTPPSRYTHLVCDSYSNILIYDYLRLHKSQWAR